MYINLCYDELEARVVAQYSGLCKETSISDGWPKIEDFRGSNGLRRGELFMFSARNTGKSIFEREMIMRMLKERQPALKADLFWLDEMLYFNNQSGFFGISKEFRKLFSQEVLDAPEVPTVEWANFLKEDV